MRKLSNPKRPTAPKVYRPQPVPKVLQTKSATPQPPAIVQSRKVATAPPIYQARKPVAPPVYRPEAKKIVQLKSISPQRKSPTPPPPYRPEQKRIAQPKNRSATDPLRVQAKFPGSVLSARAIQGMRQEQVIQRAESQVVSSGPVAAGRGRTKEREDNKDQGHLVKRVTRGSSKPPPDLNRLTLHFRSSYKGVASQQLDKQQQIGFHQTATLFRPENAPQSAAHYYDFRQQVKDSYTYHIPSETKPLDAAFDQDNGFGPPYENETTTVNAGAIRFEDHPGFSLAAASIPEGHWLSRYEVRFRWTVTRHDAEGNGASWTSPEVIHTVECAYNEGEPVQITHHAAGNFNWNVVLA